MYKSPHSFTKKKIVRIISGVRPRTHSEPLFKQLKILNIDNINKFLMGRFMYHIYNYNTLRCSFQSVQEILKSTPMKHDNRTSLTFLWFERKLGKLILDTKVPLCGMISWKVVLELLTVRMFLSRIWNTEFRMVCRNIHVSLLFVLMSN